MVISDAKSHANYSLQCLGMCWDSVWDSVWEWESFWESVWLVFSSCFPIQNGPSNFIYLVKCNTSEQHARNLTLCITGYTVCPARQLVMSGVGLMLQYGSASHAFSVAWCTCYEPLEWAELSISRGASPGGSGTVSDMYFYRSFCCKY